MTSSRLFQVSTTVEKSAAGFSAWARRDWRDLTGLLARLVLGGVLLVAGALKLTNLPGSVLAVRAYRLLPYDLAVVVGYGLPIVEVAVGLLLVLGLFTRACAVIGSALMVAFTIGIASAWARGLALDCGCFGGGGEIALAQALRAYPWEIARDLGLLALGAWLVWRPTTPWALDDTVFPAITDDDLDEESA